jgi:electron transfer flavoprotein-quinone oxidoreductase
MLPKLTGDGLLVAGDAAALCLAAGIWLEGVNFALGSGLVAGEVAAAALAKGDTSARGMAAYRERLSQSFVLADHKRLRNVPHLVLSDRVQHQYPQLVCDVIERMFRVDNPAPKPGLRRILRDETRRAGVRLRDVAKDAWTGARGFG